VIFKQRAARSAMPLQAVTKLLLTE
jgi:hypothetical protein